MRKLLVAGLGLVLLGLVQPASPAPPDETAALLKALQDENRQVRLRAVRDLGNRGAASRAAVPALAEPLREPDRDLPGQAAKALAQIGPVAVPELIKALRDDDLKVRYAAVPALVRGLNQVASFNLGDFSSKKAGCDAS